ncbi:hypothetical protein HHK36_002330 [Tetracentron sinense]|uniref:Uncharacterized protein n=1 Tax=Tetracentron sinense TaxID=13715 RepID=A0A834ZUA8_TETSI|nr:hypothetical protein HHK36_002330 [Tetracentron sinense]
MDLEGECSIPRCVEERDENLEKTTLFEEINIENNGPCANEIGDLDLCEHVEINSSAEMNGKEIGTEQTVAMPPNMTESPGVSGGSPPTSKGYGLKKWKRIQRDFTNDGGSGVDFNRILKRGLSNAVEPMKPPDSCAEIKQNSEGSVASTNLLVEGLSVPISHVIKGSISDSRLAMVSNFHIGTNSENSEDRSSKSSTAASSPNVGYATSAVSGSARNKNKVKNSSGKNSGNAVQRAQPGKGRIETSKKLRGETVNTEKENSYSSVESDLRSSNMVFTQGSFSVTSNGRQSLRSRNYDGENSYEAQAREPQSSEEIRTSSRKENGGEIEDFALDVVAADISWEFKEEESENHRLPTDQDPLIESILLLQAVQEALEKEVQKFGEIGKEPILLPDDSIQGPSLHAEFTSIDPEIHEPHSSGQLHFEDIGQSGSPSLEAQLINLNQKINLLDTKLEEASAMLKAKESRVVELEAILNSSESPKEELGSTLESLQKKHRKMEIELELEGLFKQKIEAEIEYLAITATTQELKVAPDCQIELFEEQKSVAGEQKQVLHKLRDAESKAVVLKRRAEELEGSFVEFLGAEEVLKMQNRLLPHSTGVVPT